MFQKLTSMEFGISIQLVVIVCIIFSLVTASDHEKGFDLSIFYLYINSYIHLVVGSEMRNILCKIAITDQRSTYEDYLLSRSRK